MSRFSSVKGEKMIPKDLEKNEKESLCVRFGLIWQYFLETRDRDWTYITERRTGSLDTHDPAQRRHNLAYHSPS